MKTAIHVKQFTFFPNSHVDFTLTQHRRSGMFSGRRSDEIEALLGYSIDEEFSPHNEVVLVYMNGHPKLKSICEGRA